MIFVLQKEFFTNKFKNEIIKVRKSNIEYQIVILSHTESCGAIQSPTVLYRVLHSHQQNTESQRLIHTVSCRVKQSHPEFYRIIKMYTKLYKIIHNHLEAYSVTWSHVDSYRVIQSPVEPYRVIHSHTESYKVIQGHTVKVMNSTEIQVFPVMFLKTFCST